MMARSVGVPSRVTRMVSYMIIVSGLSASRLALENFIVLLGAPNVAAEDCAENQSFAPWGLSVLQFSHGLRPWAARLRRFAAESVDLAPAVGGQERAPRSLVDH